MSEEFERLVAEFERFQTKIKTMQQQAVDVDEMRGEVERLEATATSPDRSVTVVAGPAGAIRDIRFTQAALDQGAGGLAATVLATLQEAAAAAARQQAAIIERHAGGDLHIVDQVLEAQAEAFGTTVAELRERVGVGQPGGPSGPAPLEEDGQQSVLRDSSAHRPAPAPPPPPKSAADDFLRNLGGEEDDR
jgi:DNA-binding protein YbaB